MGSIEFDDDIKGNFGLTAAIIYHVLFKYRQRPLEKQKVIEVDGYRFTAIPYSMIITFTGLLEVEINSALKKLHEWDSLERKFYTTDGERYILYNLT